MKATLWAIFVFLSTAHAGISPSPASTLLAAGHRGEWTGAGVTWRSTLEVVPGSEDAALRLARPLPAGAQLDGADTIEENGQIVGLRVPAGARSLSLRTHQSLSPGDAVLEPPLPEGQALQRITLDGVDFMPDQGLGFERHLRYTAQPGVGARQRRALDLQLSGEGAHARDRPLYFVADARLVKAGGVRGELEPVGSVSGGVAWAVGGLFVGVVGLLALGYRLLEQRAAAEAVDLYIEREFVALPPRGPSGPSEGDPGHVGEAPAH